jgi:hypothetical protein
MGSITARPSIDYVYILGASHSGSTLLAMLLNAHPDLTTIGETAPGRMGEVDTYRCSCGRLIQECPFWANVARRMQERHSEFRLDNFGTEFAFPSNRLVNRFLHFEHRGVVLEFMRDMLLRLSPGWQAARPEIAARCRDLAAAVLAASGGRILVDSSKLAHRLKFLLRIPEFNVKVIHLVRDGRAVALTYMRQDEFADSHEPALRRGGRGMQEKPTAAALSMERAADEWYRCLRSAEHVLARLDRCQWMRVRYERLCDDPQGTLANIHGFLKTDPKLAVVRFRDVEHHVIGNGMRLDDSSEIRRDERWRNALSEQDLQVFESVAGAMNRRYGYDP